MLLKVVAAYYCACPYQALPNLVPSLLYSSLWNKILHGLASGLVVCTCVTFVLYESSYRPQATGKQQITCFHCMYYHNRETISCY